MARKPVDKSNAIVPASGRKPPATGRAGSPAAVPLTGATRLPVRRPELALSKLLGTGGELAQEQSVTLVMGRAYAAGDLIVPAEAVYYDAEARPKGDGPWLGEADKVAWRDEASGLDCIMLRDFYGGYLRGYVGVPQDHPLWGWDHGAVPPDMGIVVHGGLSYSAICQHGPKPLRSIVREGRVVCHVQPWHRAHAAHPNGYAVADTHAWWFGFECNHAYDVIPAALSRISPTGGSEIRSEYRNDAYVVREVLALAAQLRAIADGRPAPARDGPPPSVGLDPNRGG